MHPSSAKRCAARVQISRTLATHPGNEATELRVIAQRLDRVVLPLQFLLGECGMNGGMTDPVQRYGFSPLTAARHQMVLVDAAAHHELAPA
jgi:hypothetical protein